MITYHATMDSLGAPSELAELFSNLEGAKVVGPSTNQGYSIIYIEAESVAALIGLAASVCGVPLPAGDDLLVEGDGEPYWVGW